MEEPDKSGEDVNKAHNGLSFPSFVEDRLLFLTSLLEEVIQGEVTENMVDPLVCVFFPFYHEK